MSLHFNAYFKADARGVCDTHSIYVKWRVVIDDWGSGERNILQRHEFSSYSLRDELLQEDDTEWEKM